MNDTVPQPLPIIEETHEQTEATQQWKATTENESLRNALLGVKHNKDNNIFRMKTGMSLVV